MYCSTSTCGTWQTTPTIHYRVVLVYTYGTSILECVEPDDRGTGAITRAGAVWAPHACGRADRELLLASRGSSLGVNGRVALGVAAVQRLRRWCGREGAWGGQDAEVR